MDIQFVLILLVLEIGLVHGSSLGRKFYFSIPEANPARQVANYVKFHISAKESTQCRISFHATAYHLNPVITGGQTEIVPLFNSVVNNVAGLSKASVFVDCDDDVSVYVMLREPNSSDGFLALPVSSNFVEYYVVAYTPLTKSEFTVTASDDGTAVNIVFKVAHGGYAVYQSTSYSDGDHLSVHMNKFDAIQIQSSSDLTGTHVLSNKPVSLVSGNECANVPVGVGACDIMLEHIPPVNAWRKVYLVGKLKTRDYLRLRILSAEDGNTIRIGSLKTVVIDTGDFYEYVTGVDEALIVRGTGPMLVIQYAESTLSDHKTGDPFMLVVPSPLDYGTKSFFLTPGNLPSNFITVACETFAISGLRLDNSVLDTSDVKTTSDDRVNYSIVRVSVSPGQHYFWHIDNHTRFGAIIYGFGETESYGFPLGFTNTPALEYLLTSYCTTTRWHIELDLQRLQTVYPGSVASYIYFGDENCTGVERGHALVFDKGINECLAKTKVTDNDIVHSNQLVYAHHDPVYNYIIRNINWTLEVSCHVEQNQSSHSQVALNETSSNNQGTINTTSQYSIHTEFYSDPNFLHPLSGSPLQVSVGGYLFVKAYVENVDWTVRMKLHTCFTKNTDGMAAQRYYLIKDGCAVDSNTHYISQADHEARFVFQAFEISGAHGDLYIECDAKFCDTQDGATNQQCDPSPHCVAGK